MNISFDIDGNEAVWDILDGFFLTMLKEQLTTELTNYGKDKIFSGDEDIAASEERVEALKVLIRFHTTPDEYDLIIKQAYDSLSS